jgi:alpha-glucosidase
MPVARSLAIDHTHDSKIYDGRYHNQFLAGHGILVCPSESYKELTRVYLPQTSYWYDFYDGKRYTGGQEIIAESPLNRLPLFVKGSAIIPMQSPIQHTGEKPSDTLEVHIYYGKEKNTFVYYEDDGESFDHEKGAFFKRSITYQPQSKEIQLSAVEGSYKSKFRYLRMILHDFEDAADAVTVGGTRLALNKTDVAFMRPISKFDPIGNANPIVLAGNNNKAFVIENSQAAVVVKW